MRILSMIVALITVCVLAATTVANAQATRTWVSGVGDDANPCSRTAPCKTFAGAISKTAPSGEINCLDPGGFGGVTITKSISIICYVEAGVLVSGTNGIVVSAGVNDRVVLQGLDIEGLGTGLNGITFLAGKELYVINCHIRHFTQNGINVASSTAGGHAFINDSYIMFNGGGVSIHGAVTNIASITNSHILSNTGFAVQAITANNIVGVQSSVLNNSPNAIITQNGGQAISVGPSNLITGGGAFTSTLLFK